jgi:prepilin-type N-terminal cleavage/methylation domain-containing protein/prepilin-type processing-associated H-X9-DG protein
MNSGSRSNAGFGLRASIIGSGRRPKTQDQRPELAAGGFTLVELLVVITIIGILIALLLPAVQAAREAARMAQCQNNLKQMALAMLTFEQTNGHFPSGGWGYLWVGDPDRGTNKEQPGGWFYGILPQLEQLPLYQFGTDGDPDHWLPVQLAGSAQRIQTPLAVANCPSRREPIAFPNIYTWDTRHGANYVPTLAHTDYSACAGDQEIGWDLPGPDTLDQAKQMTLQQNGYKWPNPEIPGGGTWANRSDPVSGISYLRSEVKIGDISDGTSRTYMLGEKYLCPDLYYNGQDGADNESMYCGYDNDNHRTTAYFPNRQPSIVQTPMEDTPGYADYCRFGSAHSTGVNMAYCDGSITVIGYGIDPETHRRLGNRKDGATIDDKKL